MEDWECVKTDTEYGYGKKDECECRKKDAWCGYGKKKSCIKNGIRYREKVAYICVWGDVTVKNCY